MNAPQLLDAPRAVKLSIDGYHLLDRAGALEAYPRTELVDGVILAMSPQYRPHDYVKAELAYRLRVALEAMESPYYVLTETSVAIPPSSEPRPDVLLTDEPRGEGAVPVASVPLVIEIAVNSLAFDRGAKAAVYAAASIPEYWVVDVGRRVLHLMWAPGSDDYAKEREVALGERIGSVAVTGLGVETEGLA
ncbi:MAG: hypothetical protein AVDCRST_MAG91-3517 [uncultured Sphingomonadaceae bacterium]|uniref:Putative restriction endonuclease domain-containing protein n=1 Tax=uncultured Sphingomonadaceae bacterium TaxID=169976 RepID=A0A6J4U369_9SPHN|nr:MAG: hypothetical protein AVDCRST_MAG91-3517 [uncultured Sphingomonadaceae bacterium]